MKRYVISTILLVGACGGNALGPGSGDDPGGGTGTLVVTGSASASARVTNAQNPADFDTNFSVAITLGTTPVTTGSVTITSSTGTIELTFDNNNQGNQNRWRGTAPAYDEVYVLDVVSGEDTLEGVRVDGPDVHVFKAPEAGATVDSTMPLDVSWSRRDEAESASIDTDQIDPLAIPDTGTHTLPAGTLHTDGDQGRQNTIRVTRTNRVTPAGAAGGSEWAVSIRNEIQVLAAPVP